MRMGDELSIRPQSVNRAAIASPAFFRANADGSGSRWRSTHCTSIDRWSTSHEVLAVVRADIGTTGRRSASGSRSSTPARHQRLSQPSPSGCSCSPPWPVWSECWPSLQAVNRHIAVSAGGRTDARRDRDAPAAPRVAIGGGSAFAVVGGDRRGLGGGRRAVAVVPDVGGPAGRAHRASTSTSRSWRGCTVSVAGVPGRRRLERPGAASRRRRRVRHGRAPVRGPCGGPVRRKRRRHDGARSRRRASWCPRPLGAARRVARRRRRRRRGGVRAQCRRRHATSRAGSAGRGTRSPTSSWTIRRGGRGDGGDPDLDAIAVVTAARWGRRRIRFGCAFDDRKGSTAAPMTAGRPPAGPGEVALGRVTMQRLGEPSATTCAPHRRHAHGRRGAVIPMIDNSEPGEGAVLTSEGLRGRPARRSAAGTCCSRTRRAPIGRPWRRG